MKRRNFVSNSLIGGIAATTATAQDQPTPASPKKICPLANDYTVVWRTADPEYEIGYCPALARLPDGRLIASLLHAGPKKRAEQDRSWTVKAYTSDDGGATWQHRVDVPMIDCFPFVAGSSVYLIGGRHDLTILRSDDRGETWSKPVKITEGKLWYSHPGSAAYSNGRIYFVMEEITEPIPHGFPTHVFAPVVLSADLTDDLTKPEAWTFSNSLSFREVIEKEGEPRLLGVPFYSPGPYPHPVNARSMAPLGWGEFNLVQIRDPAHLWYDPSGRTFHLLARAVSGRTDIACLAKAVETESETGAGREITVSLEKAPSGETMLFLPFPGGQVSFHIAYDEETQLFWMISSQATDSMRRVEMLDPKHYGMPYQERNRLALRFSKNCIDWCFAGLVAAIDDVGQSHHGGNMIIDGNDLIILMRTADANAVNAHNSNLITCHRVKNFRELVY